ncbi:type ISP restriction/modification enzyme [Gloeocapsa sp. PCC 7428]|uniref:type ISP restriction/modification enzyme n=1 Tax=Gloeocapsa sp. PCC 7428 TaxID=1173026 RepID=UPI0002EFB872|nr:type ISP restriction/modification enzyme [Gloeocapsa sp. PCC 7428]
MNTVLIEHPRHRHLPNKQDSKLYPTLRKSAWHEVHSQRQGRLIADVQIRGILRIYSQKRNDEQLTPILADYPVIGSNVVEAVRYAQRQQSDDKGRVWINQKQYFKNVPSQVWNYSVGNYQICQKWIKDREGCYLSQKDIRQYQRIITALNEMIELMAGIEAVFQLGSNKEQLFIAAHQ